MNNEDTFVVWPDLGFCLASDGMGGGAGVKLATRILVETVLEFFLEVWGDLKYKF